MKILRVSDTTVYLYDLTQFLLKHNIDEGQRFGISWKVGKRRKLRSYTLNRFRYWPCDLCGNITEMEIRKGLTVTKLDNHFGPGHLSFDYVKQKS